YTPFATGPKDDIGRILKKIEAGDFNMNSGNWINISSIAKDLVGKMLDVNPKRRCRSSDVLQHMFIRARRFLPESKLKFKDIQAVKVAVNATFRAMNISPRSPKLLPVQASELARRRQIKKGFQV
ncbi:ribosomal protein S6 kinase 2 alpha-like, partial [Stegodyphus dumicola]|uniref:ribosomal protein S6 kinase 2 alpha-like n=1 Tax=Stegodyphus dumicola TaxID=202533 RepID=UPI0015A7E748